MSSTREEESSRGAGTPHTVFTASQIMTLQAQVKAFKELTQRYSDLEIAKVVERAMAAPPLPANHTVSSAQPHGGMASSSSSQQASMPPNGQYYQGPSRAQPHAPPQLQPHQQHSLPQNNLARQTSSSYGQPSFTGYSIQQTNNRPNLQANAQMASQSYNSQQIRPQQSLPPQPKQYPQQMVMAQQSRPVNLPQQANYSNNGPPIPQRTLPINTPSAPASSFPSSSSSYGTSSSGIPAGMVNRYQGGGGYAPMTGQLNTQQTHQLPAQQQQRFQQIQPQQSQQPVQQPVPGNPPPPPSAALSCQCFGSLLFMAPTNTLPPSSSSSSSANDVTKTEPTVSVTNSNVDPFLKNNITSQTLTRPYSLSIKEKLLEHHYRTHSPSHEKEWDLFYKQRLARAQLAAQFKPLEMVGKVITLNPRKNAAKERKKSKKDMRAFEREQLRLRQGLDDAIKRKLTEFHRVLFAHRDEFVKFHKEKRSESTKLARLAKAWIDGIDARRSKEEIRVEQLRLQALKQHDMEAYSKLVDETKNERLRFLLSETDTFIKNIQDKIELQRDQGTSLIVEPNPQDAGSAALASSNRPNGSTSQNYLEHTHRKTEKVMQPTMLKGGQLKEYQLEGLRWMVSLYNNNLNGILADEMGLGKTIQTIALLAYLIEFKDNHGPFMVVVPLSTLSNWVNECAKWAPEIINVVYRGNPVVRRAIYKDEIEHGRFNVLMTTYEYIMRDKSALKRIKWQYVIVDEGHRMKNAQSKFAQILGNQYTSKHRILLTGTPLQNNLPELWALLNFLLPYIFGSMESFDQWFNQPFAAFQAAKARGETNNPDSGDASDMAQLSQEERLLVVHRLHEVLRPFLLRRVKAQVLDQLPEKVEMVIRCKLSGWQRKLYRVIQDRGRSMEGDLVKGGINNVLMQLRKVCNHPYLFLNEWYADDDLIRASGKFELLDRMLPKLKAGGHRVLMFSQMTHVMTILERFFEMKGFAYLRLDGGTSAEEREKRMFMFNEPESPYFIFLLSTRAGGLGLNLASADTVFIFDSDWNPMMDAQAQDRAHRIGQKNEVHVFRIVTTTAIEEKILSRAAEKISLNGLVVEAGEFNMNGGGGNGGKKGVGGAGEVTEDRREMMEALMREWSGEALVEEDATANRESDLMIPDDDQLNEMMAANEDELALYQRLDKEREQKRIEDWTASHGPNVPLPPRLMDVNSPPAWITPALFQPTNAALVEGMMMRNEHGKPMGTAGKKSKKVKHKKTEYPEDNDGFGDGIRNDSEESDDEEDDGRSEVASSVGGASSARKRKLPNVILYNDSMTDVQFERFLENGGELSSTYEGGRKRSRGNYTPVGALSAEDQSKLCRAVQALTKIKKPDGSNLSELFKKKPDRTIFADYYTIIEQPWSIKDITDRLKRLEYGSIEEIDAHFDLICSNARRYNEDGSFVVTDAETLKAEFVKRSLEYRSAKKNDDLVLRLSLKGSNRPNNKLKGR